jgi:hypothetical protein
MPLSGDAQIALDQYLSLLDGSCPGLADGVYLTGSAALDDWQPGQSDLDILVVTDRRLDETDVDALADVHAKLTDPPYRDAIYVNRAVVGYRPRPHGDGAPFTVDGVFRRSGYQPDPVLWSTLDRHGVTVRGTPAAELGARPDAQWLRDWNLGNLNSYWRTSAKTGRAFLTDRPPESTMPAKAAVWGALGPGRLHHTIATGEVISKTAAADYTAGQFPEYGELLSRAKAWRLGAGSDIDAGTAAFTIEDGYAICDLIEAIVEDAPAR